MNNRLLTLMKHKGQNRLMAVILIIAMMVCSPGIDGLSVKAEAGTGYTTLYFVDKTPEHWIGNDNAVIELIDNTYGHDRYVMSTNDRITWSVRVPKSTYNVTFNRYNSSKTTQWNSWSAGGRDGYTTYYAQGHEYGFWGGDKDTEEGFQTGDVIYLDFYEFSGWKQSDAGFYVNFTKASKEDNGGCDVDINTADKAKFSPTRLVNEVEDDVFTHIVTEEEAGSSVLRFWRGNDNTLWNCSIALSYEEFKAGNNCVKIQGWNDTGYVCPYVPRRHVTQIDSMELMVTGNRKVNRRLVLDLNIIGETECLVKEDTRITVLKNNDTGAENPDESEATEEQCVFFDETASVWNHRELIVKEPGTYTITAVVTDGVDDFTTETTVVIAEDMVPVADYRLNEDSHIYTRDENGAAYVEIKDCSVSEQGDAIVSRTYEIYYDADLDGRYSEDEKIDTIDGNETEVSFKLTNVGKYKVKLSVQEHFEDTIESIIDESVYLSGNTEDRSMEDVTFEITNLAPFSSMSIQKSRLANIVFTVGDADSEILKQYIGKSEGVKEYLESQGIQAKVSTISTSVLTAQDTFAWREYDHYNYDDFLLPMIPKHILYQDRDIIMKGYSMSPMKDFLYVEENDSSRKVFEFDLQRDSTDWHSMEGGGFLFNTKISEQENYIQGYCILVTQSGLELIQIYKTNLSHFRNNVYTSIKDTGRLLQTFPLANLYENHHLRVIADKNVVTVYDGENVVIHEYVLPDDGVAAYGYGPITCYKSHLCGQQSYFTFKNIVMQTIKGESLSDVVNEHDWTPGTNHYVINLSQATVPELMDADRMSDVAASLIQNDVMFFGIGNNNNINQYNALVNAMDGKGSSVIISEDNEALGSETEDERGTATGKTEGVKTEDAVDNIISRIAADIRSKDYSVGYTLASDELVEYSGTYFDPDGDPVGAEMWEYVYDNSVFNESEENSRQTIRCASPITIFKQTGAYEISLKVSDNPAGENEALSVYAKWSETDNYQKLILSQHRPVAKIHATVMESPDTAGMCIAGITYEAYDEDHPSDSRRGIRGEEFCYKEINDTSWTEGKLPSCLPIGGTYLVKYVVKDIEGTMSRPAVCVIKTNEARNYKEPEDNTAPEVQLSVSAAVTEPGMVFYIEASATDDYGVVDFNVCVNGKEIAKSYGRYAYVPDSTGELIITASATDICGNAATETRTVSVVDKSDTTPPVIEVISPKNGTVTGKVDIIGSITDNKQLKSYKAEFYDCNGNRDNSLKDESVYGDAVLIASGTEEIRKDKIAQFNADSLLKGVYRIVITAEDMSGLVTTCTIFITVEEDMNADKIPPQAVISGVGLSEDCSGIIITGTVCDETQISGYELVIYELDENGNAVYSRIMADGNETISDDVIGFIGTETLESGRYRIELKAADAAGNHTTAAAEFEYTNASGGNAGEINQNDDNTAPVILAELTTKIADEGIYVRLDGIIEDENLQSYTIHTGRWNAEEDGYKLFCISRGTEHISDGVIAEYTYTGVKAGNYMVRAEAVDAAGNIKTVEYTFTVTEEGYIAGEYVGDEPVAGEGSKDKLSFILGTADGDISEPVPIYISYPKRAEDITLTFNGNDVEIDGRTASVIADSAGSYEVLLSAVIDGERQTVSDTIRFYDKSDVTPPEACFISPKPDSVIKTITDITGTVSDNRGIAYYTLEYRLEGTDSYKKISSGTEPVYDGVLGKIDTTLLMNGRYILRLTVVDHGGHRIRTERAINVEGNLKIGNMSIGFTDMWTDVSGLPLILNRYYDSRNKASGDFGVGWSLGLQSVNLIESSDIRQGYQLIQTGNRLSTAYYLVQTECHDITVTYGDGTSDRFELTVTPDRQGLLPICEVEVRFTCVTNPNVSLILDGDSKALVYGSRLIFEDDTLLDKQSYVLERTDGTKFYLDSERGLKKMEDLNGNAVIISSSGYKHSNGTGILFERDAQGRIVSAAEMRSGEEEPVNRTEYAYDNRGNLISVTDIAGRTVTFTYDDDHNMTGIIDPSGIAVARNEYDEEGRLIATVDADGSRITYTHDIDGRQEVVRDRRGNATVYTYDENGNVIRIVDALGNVTEKTYDENNNLLTAKDALGKVTTFEYDERNNLIKTTDAFSQITAMEYGTRNEILKITQNNLLSVFMTYDKKGNITSSADTAGNVTEYFYEANGSLKSISDSIGTVMTLTYDSAGRVATSMDGVGNTVIYAYDNKGNCISTEVTRQTEEGSVTIRNLYFYDASGRVVRTMDSLGGEETLEYDENGRIKAMTDEKGIRTSYGYDRRGNVTAIYYSDGTAETFTYDADGNMLTSTDRLNLTRTYEYDKLGRNVSITLPDGNQVRYEYDAVGNLTGYLSVTGARTTYGYDKLGRNTSVTDDDGNSIVYTYGSSSELLSVTDKMGRTTAYGYDNAGNVISVTYADGSVHRMSYDARSRLVSETDAEGNVTEYEYDNADRLISVTDALGNKTEYEYDNLGKLQKVTDARGNVTTYEYDTLGRRISDTDALGRTHTYEYSETGNLVAETSYSGTLTKYFYDEFDRLVRKSVSNSGTGGVNAGSGVTTYTRDSYGRITDITDESGTVSYQYDELGRIKCVTGADGIMLRYGYDSFGRKISVAAVLEGTGTSPADEMKADGMSGADCIGYAGTVDMETVYGETYYVYDKYNRLIQVSDIYGNYTEYAYNADDTLASETDSNGIVTAYGYDGCGSLSSMKSIDAGSQTVAEYWYVRGADGEIIKLSECVLQADGTVMEKVTEYCYDSVKRLIKEVIRDKDGSITFEYGYDETYNRISQMIQFAGTVDGLLDETGKKETEEGEITYVYDACNQLVRETWKTKDGIATEKTYTYDTDGNLIQENSESGTKTYGYNVKGHMVSAVVKKTVQCIDGAEQAIEKTEETYGYDAEGVRIWKETDNVRTDYAVDKSGPYSQILVERKETGEVYYHTRGHRLVCRTERTTGDINAGSAEAETRPVFYLYDGHRTTRQLTDGLGTVTDSYSHNAYGIMLTKEGTTDNSFHYCGEQRDTTTGLYYLRARYMNPQTASFTQKDSYAGGMYSPETQNGYLYTGGNPVMYADPGGNSYSLAETLTSFGISEALSDVIVTSTYYMILAGELGASITITREAYNAGVIERVKNKLISIYEEDPYIPIFVAEDGVREIIIDTIPEKEPFKETMPEYEGERQDIMLDPGLVQKSFWDTIMWNEGGSSTTNLYRVMSEAEYNSVMSNGKFVSYDRAMEEKWFATTQDDAIKWANIFYPEGDYRMIEANIDTNYLQEMYYNQHLDNIGPAYCSPLEVLEKALKSIKGVK